MGKSRKKPLEKAKYTEAIMDVKLVNLRSGRVLLRKEEELWERGYCISHEIFGQMIYTVLKNTRQIS